MKASLMFATAILGLFFSVSVWSSDKPEHFKGLQPSNLEEAVSNFAEFNAKLSVIINQEALSPEDMHLVHEITYTLENAMEKMSSELELLEETLEAVHVASEHADTKTIKVQGKRYIETAKKLAP